MTVEQESRLKAKSGVGQEVWFKDKMTGRSEPWGRVEDEVYVYVGDYKHVLQRICCHESQDFGGGEKGCYWDGSRYGYRTGRKLLWGQYTQFLTEKEYRSLLARAKAKGWNVF